MKWFLVLLPFYIFALQVFFKEFPFYSLLKSLRRNYTNVNITRAVQMIPQTTSVQFYKVRFRLHQRRFCPQSG